MGRVKARSLRLREAAELLGVSYRQSKRIWARYRGGGAKALQHGNCGRGANRAYAAKFRAAVLERVKAHYEDFGPTLAAEHLGSDDGLKVQAETLRRWMKEAGLWRRQRRRKPYRQRRGAKNHFCGFGRVSGRFYPGRAAGGAKTLGGGFGEVGGSFPAGAERGGPGGLLNKRGRPPPGEAGGGFPR